MKPGTVLVPKPEHKSKFPDDAKYVVTMADIIQNGTIGEYWMEKPDEPVELKERPTP